MKLILASGSPRRLALLQKEGVEPIVRVPDVDETIDRPLSPTETVIELATRKARAAAKEGKPEEYILCADTIVACENEILGKPKNEKDAYRMLRLLSGSTHHVLTGHCIAHNNEFKWCYEDTKITFRELTDDEINAYIDSGEPFGKAGAYAIQEKGDRFVKAMDGAWDNVVGLSINCVKKLLSQYEKNLEDFI